MWINLQTSLFQRRPRQLLLRHHHRRRSSRRPLPTLPRLKKLSSRLWRKSPILSLCRQRILNLLSLAVAIKRKSSCQQLLSHRLSHQLTNPLCPIRQNTYPNNLFQVPLRPQLVQFNFSLSKSLKAFHLKSLSPINLRQN